MHTFQKQAVLLVGPTPVQTPLLCLLLGRGALASLGTHRILGGGSKVVGGFDQARGLPG